MPGPHPADAARAAAERAFAQGKAQTHGANGRLGAALAIHDEGGAPIGWFVPVIAQGRILGFVQLDGSFRFLRCSSFATDQDYPEAALWLEPERVRRTAQQVLQAGDVLGEAVLGYHRTPTRLAWVLRLRRGPTQLVVYVTGATAWTEADDRRLDGPDAM